MAVKVKIVFSETIKPFPSTPTDRNIYKLSLLDEVASALYIPVVLFYCGVDQVSDMIDTLKISLAKTLADFYPFAGRMKGNSSIECNDKGVPFVEARLDVVLSEFIENPNTTLVEQLIPFPTSKVVSEEEPLLGVKVTTFRCGGTAVGVCMSHKVTDGSTVASFISSWSRKCSGAEFDISLPRFDASTIFPLQDFNFPMPAGTIVNDEKLVTKRFCFGGKELLCLKNEFRNMNPTKVEAVTALIWKTALEATIVSSGQLTVPPSAATHVVNIRARADPPLPEQTVGNLWQNSVTTVPEGVELDELASLLRKSIKKIDSDHVRSLRGENGLTLAYKTHLDVRELASKGVRMYRFSS